MAEIRPFKGLRYSAAVDLQTAVAPPYDVLSTEQAVGLRARSPFNAVHVDLPVMPGESPSEKKYEDAGDTLRTWRQSGALHLDGEPALYVIAQVFHGPDGRLLTRRGFIGRLVLEGDGHVVRPHEKTHAAPRSDRLQLMRAAHADLSPIFLLSPDDDGSLAAAVKAAAETTSSAAREVSDADGNLCRIAPLRGAPAQRLAALLRDRDLYIADGHHRYQTALAYRDERRAAGDQSADTLMVFLCSMSDPGLAVFPAHRLLTDVDVPPAEQVLERLRGAFAVDVVQADDPDWAATCVRRVRGLSSLSTPAPPGGQSLAGPDPARVFALAFARERLCCTLTLRDDAALRRLQGEGHSVIAAGLSVTILHDLILRDAVGLDPARSEGHIDYMTDADLACRELAGGRYTLGAFLNAPSVAQVRAVADSGETMPQKSTYFYPKLLTGLVYDALGC